MASKPPDVDKFEDITGMDLFKPGKHNGDIHRDKIIDDMVANFSKLDGQIRPKLKITHKESQEKLAGLASYGDVKKIYSKIVNGIKHLFADIVNVPKEVIAFIKDRRFPERSIEIYPNIEVDGTNFKNVLRNISLLGHEPPAVKGLAPVKLSDDNGIEYNVINFDDKGGETDMGNEVLEAQITKLKEDNDALIKKLSAIDDEAEKKKFQDQIDAKDEEIKKLVEANKKITDLEKEAKDGKEATDKLTKLQEDTKKADITASIDKFKADGNIKPAQESLVKSLMEILDNTEVKKYTLKEKDSEKDIELTAMGLFKEILKAQSVVKFKEQGPKGEKIPSGSEEDDEGTIKLAEGTVATKGEALDKKIKAYMDEHKVSYQKAMLEVSE